MSGVSEMSSNDTATSDVLTSVSNVATAVSTVTVGIAPSGLSGYLPPQPRNQLSHYLDQDFRRKGLMLMVHYLELVGYYPLCVK
ncbi:hypothetical protein DD238_007248 [Peronospora effusa]|uniref:Uncharacterized protein n=1 Tax=Peronospora effusa TaxID=542832 RepID=A0A3M6VG34_9STRA|nr:hypothetical protein DD238_007248 [Peronospora effusa]RQM15843.1 hypothetical protein DD237_005854 [Peronospora effusa]